MAEALAPSYRGSHDEHRLTTRWPGARPDTAPAAAPAIDQPSLEINGRVLAIFSDYDGLWNAVRARVDAMGITREALNDRAELQEGYIGKLLGGAQGKKFGRLSLGKTLEAIGCDLALIEDEILTAKIRIIDRIIAAASGTLGISRTELARLAGLRAMPPKVGMSEIDAALVPAGCKLALVENPDGRRRDS